MRSMCFSNLKWTEEVHICATSNVTVTQGSLLVLMSIAFNEKDVSPFASEE